MFFRNLMFFTVPTPDLSFLEESLRENPLKPVGPSELSSRGWVSPFGTDSELLVHRQGQYVRVTLGGEDRVLPLSVVSKELSKRLAEIEEQRGRKLGGKKRKQLKEDIVLELLPRALVKPYRLDAHFDPAHNVLMVDTSSRKQAEALVSELRHALGSFPALPVNAEVSVRAVLTGWVSGEPLPKGLTLGEEAQLEDPIDGGARARVSRQELLCDEIRMHLESGKQVTRLGLVWQNCVSFVVGDDLVVRKLKFLDAALEQLQTEEHDSLAAELDARYFIMATELTLVFYTLAGAFKITDITEDLA